MGYGSYRSSDWSRLKDSSKITHDSTANDIFKSNSIAEKFDPKFVSVRESRDSEEHPNSTPVIIGLDVTGSMGYLSAEIAKNGLHETMMKIYSTKPIEDPQMMFAAIGDVVDKAPLQVTHFESDIRIAEQLMELWLEGRGGDGPEDYPLLWYFAAKHTAIDSYSKHGKKGFLFTIGDADCHPNVQASDINRIFNDSITEPYLIEELSNMASEQYELFHIHLSSSGNAPVPPNFTKAIPGRVIVIPKANVDRIPEIIISVMELINGKDQDKIIEQWDPTAQPVVKNAIGGLNLKTKKKKGFFF